MIIPVLNGAAFLDGCLSALLNQHGAGCTVVVVDNGSSDGSAELVASRFPGVTLLCNRENQGFSRGVNRGLRHVLAGPQPPEVCVLLNQDTAVEPGWLGALLAAFERQPLAGAVGCKIYDGSGRTLQHTGGLVDYPRAVARHRGQGEVDRGQYDAPGEQPYVTGAALGLRAAALREVGLLDERCSPAYMEEVDLCWRLRAAGWQVRYEPAARLRHVEHGSPLTIIPRLRLVHRNRLRFVFKHYRADQLLEEFWPAERHALARNAGSFDTPALMAAFLDGQLLLDELLAARSDMDLPPFTAGQRRQAVTMLRELREDLRLLRDLGH